MNRFASVIAVGALAFLPSVAAAQTSPAGPITWGPQVSIAFDASDVGVGARLQYSLSSVLGGAPISGHAEANWFPGTVNVFDFNYNVVYNFQAPSLSPYAGGGLNFTVASGSGNTASDLHLNAVGGVVFKPLGKVTPALQLRYTFVQGDNFFATLALLF